MKLETEFRLRLQLMQLEQAWCDSPSDCRECFSVSESAIARLGPQFALAPGLWVKLLQAPGPFSGDDALLLCQDDDQQWHAWVPDYGEIRLDQDEFYPEWDGLG